MKKRANSTHLEQVLLITQTLLFLLSQLVQRIVVPIKVDELVIAFRRSLSDPLANLIEVLAGLNDPAFDELKLGSEGVCHEHYILRKSRI